MNEADQNNTLLTFFKALADENRLKIVGLLAQQPHTVENLAEVLGVSASTASHHLSKLAKAGLVAARTDGHYYIYSLQTDALKEMAQNLLHEEKLTQLHGQVSEDAFEKKVLAAFIDADGKITAFPAQEKKYRVLLNYVLQAFEPGVEYTEKQVNEILGRYNKDTAMLRRNLVDYKMMERTGGGGVYWRPLE